VVTIGFLGISVFIGAHIYERIIEHPIDVHTRAEVTAIAFVALWIAFSLGPALHGTLKE
jgi:hypothetical protein